MSKPVVTVEEIRCTSLMKGDEHWIYRFSIIMPDIDEASRLHNRPIEVAPFTSEGVAKGLMLDMWAQEIIDRRQHRYLRFISYTLGDDHTLLDTTHTSRIRRAVDQLHDLSSGRIDSDIFQLNDEGRIILERLLDEIIAGCREIDETMTKKPFDGQVGAVGDSEPDLK